MEHDLDELEADINQISADIQKTKQNAPPNAADIMPKARSLIGCFDKLLVKSANPLVKECLLGLMFDSLPTYDDLAVPSKEIKAIHTLFVAEVARNKAAILNERA